MPNLMNRQSDKVRDCRGNARIFKEMYCKNRFWKMQVSLLQGTEAARPEKEGEGKRRAPGSS